MTEATLPEGRGYGRSYGFWGPGDDNRSGGSGLNMAAIAYLRKWSEKIMGPSHLKIVRDEVGTRVTLRFFVESATYEVDVKVLDSIRKRRLKPPHLREAILCVCIIS